MTRTSHRMKGLSIASLLLIISTTVMVLSSCTKTGQVIYTLDQTNKVAKHSSDVIDKWMTLQLRLIRNTTGIPNQGFSRPFAYSGIAAFESIAPGLPANDLWSKWNGLGGLPAPDRPFQFYYPANVNAALASINRSFFANATAADKLAIDSLENVLKTEFLASQPTSLIEISSQFGKSAAAAVFNWSEADGHKNAVNPYSPPTGEGLWVPTAPTFANASTPYWGNNRTVIMNSALNSQPGTPTAYSTDPESDFFEMVKEVYDASQNLTTDQKAMALFWRDVPGITSPGHWLSILQQTIRQTKTSLDKAALAYALTGSAINDALISCWQTKYHYNLVRPITYIRNVMGHDSWNSFLTTPPHPEYCSAHASLSMAAAETMQKLFGNIGSFTDHTYDYLGFSPRNYSSFIAIGEEASISRLYAGIHYKPSIEAGIQQGKIVTQNIFKGPSSNSHSFLE